MIVDYQARREPREWVELRCPRDSYDYSGRAKGWAMHILQASAEAAVIYEVGPPSGSPARELPSGNPPAVDSSVERLNVARHVKRSAEGVLHALKSEHLRANRVVRSAGGGIALYFFGADVLSDGSHHCVASIEVDEDGELMALYKDRVADSAEVVDIPGELTLAQAIAKVSLFLRG